MSNISSKTLFHFTKSSDSLISILKNGFYPKFCLEEITIKTFLDKVSEEEAIAMTCFCDLPLFQISEHIEFYGSYGIGLSKIWGSNVRLNPISYLNLDSSKFDTLKNVSILLNSTENYNSLKEALKNKSAEVFKSPYFLLEQLITQFKPYKGKMWRVDKYVEKIFYNEREWRYVPEIKNLGIHSRLSKKEFLNGIKKSSADFALRKDYSLDFKAADVKYIIVNNEDEMVHLFDAIDSMFDIYNSREMKLLKTKIISTTQILEDF